MVTSLERRVMEELRDSPEKRKRFCRRFLKGVNRQTGLEVGNDLIEALDFILRNVDPEKPKRLGVISGGSLHQRVRGHVHKLSGLMQYSVRVGRTSGTSVYLPGTAPQYLDAQLNLTVREAIVTWRHNGEVVKVSSFRPKEHFTYFELRKRLLDTCSGVFLGEMDAKRRIRYANTEISIPTWRKSSIFLTVHNWGEINHFDLAGRIVFASSGVLDFTESQRLEKASKMEEETNGFDYEAYRREVTEYLVRKWKKEPRLIDRRGHLVIVSGRQKVRIDHLGKTNIGFTDDNGRRNSFVVSILYAESNAEAEFRGGTVLFHHLGGGLLNSYRAEGIGFQRSFFEGENQLEYMGIRHLDVRRKRFSVKLNGADHRFSLPELLGTYFPQKVSQCAVLYHRKLRSDPTFQLVVQLTDETKIEDITPKVVY